MVYNGNAINTMSFGFKILSVLTVKAIPKLEKEKQEQSSFAAKTPKSRGENTTIAKTGHKENETNHYKRC
jgi:hypothetical protein